MVLPPPIWWNSRLRLLGILAGAFRLRMVPWCPTPIVRTAKVSSLASVFLVVSEVGWWTVGTCHCVGRMRWCPFVWMANSSLLWRYSLTWIVLPNGFHKCLRVFLLRHTRPQLVLGIWDKEGRSLFLYNIPYNSINRDACTFSRLASCRSLGNIPPYR